MAKPDVRFMHRDTPAMGGGGVSSPRYYYTTRTVAGHPESQSGTGLGIPTQYRSSVKTLNKSGYPAQTGRTAHWDLSIQMQIRKHDWGLGGGVTV